MRTAKCLNCGSNCTVYLCDKCATPDILDKIFNEVMRYNPDTCTNKYVNEYVSGVTEKYAERDCIPEILSLFDDTVSDFYFCRYYFRRKEERTRFETAAIGYIDSHELSDIHTQLVMRDLLDYYIPNDFVKPERWCDVIFDRDDLSCELYQGAAQYFSMIGEYDKSDILADRGLNKCNEDATDSLLFSSLDFMKKKLKEQKESTRRYRDGKPYWPQKEERRRAVAMFYDEKGITYPRIETKPKKVPEDEFGEIKEYEGDTLSDYCAFWCCDAFSMTSAKCIYQIGVVKVRNREAVDTFESFVRPWNSSKDSRKRAAKEANVSLETIEGAEDVDIVIGRFFEFVGNDVLVSTDALSKQSKLLSRAARYTGMKEIRNEFMDLLDLAADVSDEFDNENNKREYLLSAFSIDEGTSALQKAEANRKIYEALLNYGG